MGGKEAKVTGVEKTSIDIVAPSLGRVIKPGEPPAIVDVVVVAGDGKRLTIPKYLRYTANVLYFE